MVILLKSVETPCPFRGYRYPHKGWRSEWIKKAGFVRYEPSMASYWFRGKPRKCPAILLLTVQL